MEVLHGSWPSEFSHSLGQKPKSWRLKVTSALARTADIVRRDRQEGRIHLRPSLKFEGCKACRWNPSAYFARQANHFVFCQIACPAPLQKYFRFGLTQISCISKPSRPT